MVLDSGDDFQDMLKELREISPNRTRAECKLLLRRIKEVRVASQVTCGCGVHADIMWLVNYARVHTF